jgi:hypothetical protein
VGSEGGREKREERRKNWRNKIKMEIKNIQSIS